MKAVPGASRGTQSPFKAYLVLLIVFVVGGLAGAAIAFSVTEEHFVHPPGREHGKRWEKRRLDALARELRLSEDQKRSVGEILSEQRAARHDAMQEMFEKCGAGLREQKEALDGRIMALLNPEQQVRFKELASEHDQRFLFGPKGRGRGKSHGHGPGRGKGAGEKKKKHRGDGP